MQNSLAAKRTVGLDFLKYVCCFLVIVIHSELPEVVDKLVLPLTRVAVPIFFMITGYFYTGSCERNRTGKQIVKIIKLITGANLLHFLWAISKLVLKAESLAEYFEVYFKLETWVNLFIFNSPPHKNSLWYLNALLYVLLIAFVLKKIGMKSFKKLYPLIPILLIGNLILSYFSSFIFSQAIEIIYSRNFLFLGLPFFLLGDMLYNRKIKIKNSLLIILTVFFAVTSVVENLILINKFSIVALDFFISTGFLSVLIFALTINSEDAFAKKSITTKIAELGRKHTLYIYILHTIVINVWGIALEIIFGKFTSLAVFETPLMCIGPFVFLAVSTVASWLITEAENKFRKYSHK